MVSEKENIYKKFNTDKYCIKYPVEINGIDQVIDLNRIRNS